MIGSGNSVNFNYAGSHMNKEGQQPFAFVHKGNPEEFYLRRFSNSHFMDEEKIFKDEFVWKESIDHYHENINSIFTENNESSSLFEQLDSPVEKVLDWKFAITQNVDDQENTHLPVCDNKGLNAVEEDLGSNNTPNQINSNESFSEEEEDKFESSSDETKQTQKRPKRFGKEEDRGMYLVHSQSYSLLICFSHSVTQI